MSENLYAISRAERVILVRAQKARMLVGVCLVNVHTELLIERKTLSEIGLQAFPRQRTWLHFDHNLKLLGGN